MGAVTRQHSTLKQRLRTSRASKAVHRRKTRADDPDFDGLLGRFSHAIALIRVSHRSLDANETAGDEEFVLRTGLAALDAIYNELDLAIVAIHRQATDTKSSQDRPSVARGRAPAR